MMDAEILGHERIVDDEPPNDDMGLPLTEAQLNAIEETMVFDSALSADDVAFLAQEFDLDPATIFLDLDELDF